MRRLVILAALATAAPAVLAAPSLVFEERPWGRLAVAALESAPYPHPSRDLGFASGSTFYPRDPHYIDSSVGFLVPRGFEPGNTVDLIVHFHGHGNHVRRVIGDFLLGEQLASSEVNAIMVVPQGPRDAGDSRFGRLDEPGGFEAFVREVLTCLRESGVTRTESLGRVIIMGHSGGYHTLGQIIANGDLADHIAECWLWDAAYAQQRHFIAFAARPGTRLRSICTGHLAEENTDILCGLQDLGVPALFLHDTVVTDEQLRAEKVVILRTTTVSHNDVIRRPPNLLRWLRTSSLAQSE